MLRKVSQLLTFRTIIEIVLMALSVGIGIYFEWEIANLVFFLIFLRLIIHPIPSRFPAIAAIVFLVLTAFLLVFKQKDWAENTAIWAYYSMILIVAMALMEMKNDDSNEVQS